MSPTIQLKNAATFAGNDDECDRDEYDRNIRRIEPFMLLHYDPPFCIKVRELEYIRK